MLEKEIERQMKKAVSERGGLFYKFISPGNDGVPDRLVITPTGEIWFVELKTSTGRLSKIQKHRIAELEKRKANVRVVFGLSDVLNFVNEVMPNGI